MGENSNVVNVDSTDRVTYFGVLLDFLNSVGKHQWAAKMAINVDDGVYPAQQVAYHYGLRGAKLDQLVYDRNYEQQQKLDNLEFWGRRLGYKRIKTEDKNNIIKFCQNADRRRYLRERAKRALKNGEVFDIGELIQMRLDVEKKRREKAAQQAGD